MGLENGTSKKHSEVKWKPVPGYEGYYLVSNNGEVWSIRRMQKLRSATDKYGYSYFVLCVGGARRTVKAHRLVALAFIDNPQSKPTVHHKNGIRNDNRVDNLEWATNREQLRDERTYQNLLMLANETDFRAMGAKRDFGRKRTAVYRGDKLLGTYPSLKEAVAQNGGNYTKASECAKGKRKTTGGLKFCFE